MMNGEYDLLRSFRAISGQWADLARAEAEAVRLALSERTVGATVDVQRLRLIVEHIRAASDGTVEAISARRNKHSVTPDEADELQAVIDEITAMNGEMSALYLATNAILRADMKRSR
jgi:hypothetical protein